MPKKNVSRWIKRGLMVALALAIVAAVVSAWTPTPLAVEVATVERGALRVEVTEDGRTRVKDRYVVSAPLAGQLARIELQPGDPIGEDEVLARIAPLATPLLDARTRGQARANLEAAKAAIKQAEAQTKRARASLKFAKSEVTRIVPLVERGVESRSALDRATLQVKTLESDVDSARFATRVAQHQQRMAESALERFEDPNSGTTPEQFVIQSPITGKVLAIHRESEGVTTPGAPLVELGDPRALEIVVDVLTRDAVRIESGAAAVVERWGGEPLPAKVVLVEPSAFTRMSSLGVEEQRVNVILELEAPYEVWSKLGEGYRVEARMTVWHEDAVLKVPSAALFRHGEQWAVFCVEAEHATVCPLEIGERSRSEAQVLSGLNEGQRVIVHPSGAVQEGTLVTAEAHG